MEYVFRNAPNDKPVTASLGPTHLSVDDSQVPLDIPYGEIAQINLYNDAGHFFLVLSDRAGHSIKIGSRFYRAFNEYDDYTKAYQSFVRILHHHLRGKPGVVYKSKLKERHAWLCLPIASVLSFGVALTLLYFDLSFNNMYVVAATLATGLMLLAAARKTVTSKTYDPTQIPYQCLPDGGA